MSLHYSEVLDFLKKRGYKVGDDPHQLQYVKAMISAIEAVCGSTPAPESTNSLFVHAPSGTGKTTLATLLAAYAVEHDLLEQIIYVRAEIDVGGQERGALPGDDAQKHEPYAQSFIDALDEYKPGIYSVWSQALLRKQPRAVATHPGHFRGLTKQHAFVIIDEAQNLTFTQLQTLYTRFTQDCVIVTLGFGGQCDIPPKKRELVAGLLPFQVFSIHHAKRGAWVGQLVTNYRGPFAQWSDEIQQTIEELKSGGTVS